MGKNVVRQMTLDGILIALFVALGVLRIRVGNFLEIGFGSIVIIIAALLLSPVDVLIIATIGEGINQFLSPYGITPTIPLWILPVVVRGMLIALVAYLYRRKQDDLVNHPVIYFATLMGVALIISGLDTAILYLDGLIMGYPVYYTLAQTGIRFLTSQITAVVIGILVLLIYKSIKSLMPNNR